MLTSINVLKYLVPSCLAFMLGFYLAESVTTRVYSSQIAKLNAAHSKDISALQTRLTSIIEEQNIVANTINTTSSVLASKNADSVAKSTAEETKAIVRYKDRVVVVHQPCNISSPALDYIRENVIGQ